MKSVYKYGTPEYKIDEIKAKADEILGQLKDFRIETGQIIPFSSIRFGNSGWLTGDQRISGGYSDLQAFVDWGTYSRFDKNNKTHIEKSYAAAIKWHDEALVAVEKWHLENIPHIENNKKVKKVIENFMTMVGIPTSFREEDTKSRSRTKKYIDVPAGYISDIQKSCPISDNYEGMKRSLADIRKRMDEWRQKHLDAIAQTERQIAAEDRKIRLVAKAMELAAKYGINESDYTENAGLIELVTEKAKEEWIKENYADGEPIDHSCCDECSTWHYGEHRCKCGNRRMSLTVEGNILEGFSAYPEAY